MSRPVLAVDALVVGAGPAGLAAATALKGDGAGRVVAVEREEEPGGVPRFCAHTGFGLRDLRRVLRGPDYARRWVDLALAAGVEIRTSAMVTGWAAPRRALVSGPGGLLEIEARTVVLATGARERPRATRLVPGTRPPGVFTTGQLQQWVHRQHLPVGTRALIVGAEHVSYSAVLTLRDAGVRSIALVTDLPQVQTFRLFDAFTRLGLRVPVWTQTSVSGIYGRERVDRVVLRGPAGEHTLAVDTVVFTGDFVADNELARLAQLAIDPGTGGPACDARGTTTGAGIFAAGNLVHPAETADVAAQRARQVGRAAASWLRHGGGSTASERMVNVHVAAPLLWVSPNMVAPNTGGTEPALIRSRAFLEHPRLDVTQGDHTLGSYRLRRLIPNRSNSIPGDWQRRVRPGGDVTVSVRPIAGQR